MSGFTDEEVQQVVDQFLLKRVEVPRLKTGARGVLVVKDRVYDLLTTALLLRPDSYFYLVRLAANRLSSQISEQLEALAVIQEAAPRVSRPSKLIDSTVDLANAQAAVLDLNAGLNSRSSGVRGSIGPAVDRFRRSISRFVSTELVKNVVTGSTVVETSEELQRKISTVWSGGTARHDAVVDLASNLVSALSILETVRLPESSVRDIAARISSRLGEVRTAMEGAAAPAESRMAMLELLTMRTLLTKASSFRNPELDLMPKPGDPTTGILLDSEGTPPSVSSTVSAPYNYGPGTSFAISVDGVALGPIALPGSSRAELRTKPMTPWVSPAAADEVAFELDGAAVVSYTVAAPYVDGPTAAADLNLNLPGISVAWDASTDQLVFQSLSSGDTSRLRALFDTAPRENFWGLAFPPTEVETSEVTGMPVSADQIVQALVPYPTMRVVIEEEVYGSFVGSRTAVIGEEAVLWDRVDSGADLTAAGTSATSASKNLEALGVTAGMFLHTTAPSVASYEIVGVDGPVLTLGTAPPPGVLTYRIGGDYRDVPVGARVQLTSAANPRNTGFYRVVSSEVARIELDRAIPVEDSALLATITDTRLVLSSPSTSTSGSIGVLVPSAGATALGFAVTASPIRAALTEFQITGDFLLRGVRAGDLITLTSPSAVVYPDLEIEQVTTTRLKIAGPVVYEPGAWSYSIQSARAAAYVELQAPLSQFLGDYPEIREVDQTVGRLSRGARYTANLQAVLDNYVAGLTALRTGLNNYVVSRERSIDNVIRTMQEQGFDRAIDLLLTLQLEELFTMSPDGVSYATWLIRQSATVAREVAPVSKSAASTRILQEWRPVSFQPDPFDPNSEDADG